MKFFDIFLILAILLSVLVVMLDSLVSISLAQGTLLMLLEWGGILQTCPVCMAEGHDHDALFCKFSNLLKLCAVWPCCE